MAAEWLTVAQGVTKIAEKIFGGLSKYKKLKSGEREKIADLLEVIAKDVLSVAKQMNKKEIPTYTCQSILTYSMQLPPLVERVYDPEVAKLLEPIRKLLESDESDVIRCWALDSPRSALCGHPSIAVLRTATAFVIRAI